MSGQTCDPGGGKANPRGCVSATDSVKCPPNAHAYGMECVCSEGYGWNQGRTSCVSRSASCKVLSECPHGGERFCEDALVIRWQCSKITGCQQNILEDCGEKKGACVNGACIVGKAQGQEACGKGGACATTTSGGAEPPPEQTQTDGGCEGGLPDGRCTSKENCGSCKSDCFCGDLPCEPWSKGATTWGCTDPCPDFHSRYDRKTRGCVCMPGYRIDSSGKCKTDDEMLQDIRSLWMDRMRGYSEMLPPFWKGYSRTEQSVMRLWDGWFGDPGDPNVIYKELRKSGWCGAGIYIKDSCGLSGTYIIDGQLGGGSLTAEGMKSLIDEYSGRNMPGESEEAVTKREKLLKDRLWKALQEDDKEKARGVLTAAVTVEELWGVKNSKVEPKVLRASADAGVKIADEAVKLPAATVPSDYEYTAEESPGWEDKELRATGFGGGEAIKFQDNLGVSGVDENLPGNFLGKYGWRDRDKLAFTYRDDTGVLREISNKDGDNVGWKLQTNKNGHKRYVFWDSVAGKQVGDFAIYSFGQKTFWGAEKTYIASAADPSKMYGGGQVYVP